MSKVIFNFQFTLTKKIREEMSFSIEPSQTLNSFTQEFTAALSVAHNNFPSEEYKTNLKFPITINHHTIYVLVSMGRAQGANAFRDVAVLNVVPANVEIQKKIEEIFNSETFDIVEMNGQRIVG